MVKSTQVKVILDVIIINFAEELVPKAVKLRCSLCDAVFSTSNPSRTASEHLKRGTCPNFNPSPPSFSSSPSLLHHRRKRNSSGAAVTHCSYDMTPITVVDQWLSVRKDRNFGCSRSERERRSRRTQDRNVSGRDFATRRLHAKYEETCAESESRIRDALFFQIASDGWNSGENLVSLVVNSPNEMSLYRKRGYIERGYIER